MQSLSMVGAAFVFALTGAVIRHVSAWHSAFEIVFHRGAVSALPLATSVTLNYTSPLFIALAVATRVPAASTAAAVPPARTASA